GALAEQFAVAGLRLRAEPGPDVPGVLRAALELGAGHLQPATIGPAHEDPLLAGVELHVVIPGALGDRPGEPDLAVHLGARRGAEQARGRDADVHAGRRRGVANCVVGDHDEPARLAGCEGDARLRALAGIDAVGGFERGGLARARRDLDVIEVLVARVGPGQGDLVPGDLRLELRDGGGRL